MDLLGLKGKWRVTHAQGARWLAIFMAPYRRRLGTLSRALTLNRLPWYGSLVKGGGLGLGFELGFGGRGFRRGSWMGRCLLAEAVVTPDPPEHFRGRQIPPLWGPVPLEQVRLVILPVPM